MADQHADPGQHHDECSWLPGEDPSLCSCAGRGRTPSARVDVPPVRLCRFIAEPAAASPEEVASIAAELSVLRLGQPKDAPLNLADLGHRRDVPEAVRNAVADHLGWARKMGPEDRVRACQGYVIDTVKRVRLDGRPDVIATLTEHGVTAALDDYDAAVKRLTSDPAASAVRAGAAGAPSGTDYASRAVPEQEADAQPPRDPALLHTANALPNEADRAMSRTLCARLWASNAAGSEDEEWVSQLLADHRCAAIDAACAYLRRRHETWALAGEEEAADTAFTLMHGVRELGNRMADAKDDGIAGLRALVGSMEAGVDMLRRARRAGIEDVIRRIQAGEGPEDCLVTGGQADEFCAWLRSLPTEDPVESESEEQKK